MSDSVKRFIPGYDLHIVCRDGFATVYLMTAPQTKDDVYLCDAPKVEVES